MLTVGLVFNARSMDLESIRLNYGKAVSDKKLCKTMIAQLDKSTQSPVHLAYLGAFQTIWANHVTNPISKLQTFNRGKKNIEAAVISQPDDAEIRFIRLSVQKNCPSFLGYRSNMEEDKRIIQANNNYITSALLKRMIADLN